MFLIESAPVGNEILNEDIQSNLRKLGAIPKTQLSRLNKALSKELSNKPKFIKWLSDVKQDADRQFKAFSSSVNVLNAETQEGIWDKFVEFATKFVNGVFKVFNSMYKYLFPDVVGDANDKLKASLYVIKFTIIAPLILHELTMSVLKLILKVPLVPKVLTTVISSGVIVPLMEEAGATVAKKDGIGEEYHRTFLRVENTFKFLNIGLNPALGVKKGLLAFIVGAGTSTALHRTNHNIRNTIVENYEGKIGTSMAYTLAWGVTSLFHIIVNICLMAL